MSQVPCGAYSQKGLDLQPSILCATSKSGTPETDDSSNVQVSIFSIGFQLVTSEIPSSYEDGQATPFSSVNFVSTWMVWDASRDRLRCDYELVACVLLFGAPIRGGCFLRSDAGTYGAKIKTKVQLQNLNISSAV